MSNEINNLQAFICKPSYPQKIVLKFCMGGEGVRSVGDNCGYIRPSEKVKMEKGAKPPPSRYEKKEVLAQGALIPQQDNHRGYKFQLLCANADNSSILTTILL